MLPISDWIPRIAAALLLLAAPAPAFARQTPDDPLAGHWEGGLDIGPTHLTTIVDFEARADGSYAGRITVPEQGAAAKDLPLDCAAMQPDALRFSIRGIPGQPTFTGKLTADGRIAGEFTQGGAQGTFALERRADRSTQAATALDGFADFVEGVLAPFEVPGLALAIVVDDHVVMSRGFGLRDVGKGLPVTPKTLFAIGSSTKAFTTFVLGTLVDEGKLEWDAPARRFAPTLEFKDAYRTEHITPRDLVTHRSGLPRHDLVWYNASATRDELVGRLKYLDAVEDLRTDWSYQNLMFLTAGWLVEKVTGDTWENAVRKRVFGPLGMHDSGFSVVEAQASDDFALPYDTRDGVLQAIPFRDLTVIGPAGSIESNLEDMTKWVRLHLRHGQVDGRQIIAKGTLAEMHRPQMVIAGEQTRPDIGPASYGMGWFVEPYRGHGRVHHGGNIDGFSALVTFLPDDVIGVVVLTNKGGTALTELVTRHALDRLLGLERVAWTDEAAAKLAAAKAAEKDALAKKDTFRVKDTHPSHAIAEYAGTFVDSGYGELRIEVEDGSLAATYNAIRTPLEHWHYDVWSGKPARGADPTFDGVRFLFAQDFRGDIASVSALLEPQCAPIVFRRRADKDLSRPEALAQFAGEYELQGATIRVELEGTALKLTVPGQPAYELVPKKDAEFELKEQTLIRVRFTRDARGRVTEAVFDQPNGVFTAARKG